MQLCYISETYVLSLAGVIILLLISLVGALINMLLKNYLTKGEYAKNNETLNKTMSNLDKTLAVMTEHITGFEAKCEMTHNTKKN